MTKTQQQIEDKALARINKRREKAELPTITMAQHTAARKATDLRDEYRAALIDDAMAQADKDLGEQKK
jgi:hypothetical protein